MDFSFCIVPFTMYLSSYAGQGHPGPADCNVGVGGGRDVGGSGAEILGGCRCC